jgi:hypothetical protein
MIGSTGRRMELDGPGDPLVMELEKKLGSLVGVLSKYIVERSYSQVTDNGHDQLDLESARNMCKSIIEEATILLGPKRTEELDKEFRKIIIDYFEEGNKK